MYNRIAKKVIAIGLFVATIIGCVGINGGIKNMTANAEEVEGAAINVEKIEGISDDFIMGMDISSYCSVVDSGVVFKGFDGNVLDGQGFFNLLKSCGINYIRVRVWNDPYDENGNGYGGGNCDIENAAVIGKYATNAGMKLLVDFHYSDFWADPAKQMVPKAWEGYTVYQKVTAIHSYTKESLTYLKNQGVDIGMVQIGNETTGAFCGEKDWNDMCKLFAAGSSAVREVDKNILIALHFTDPQKNRYNAHALYLQNNNVDYDVFASSFYPEWHGSLNNLTSQLKNVADTYGKKVMIVETSYPYTLEEMDGHPNEINKWDNTNPPVDGYPNVSVQGQADYVAMIIKAMVDLGDSAIGMCYWEGAWNSVGNVYPNGNWSQSVKDNNMSLWETYGSGWATSYAYSYDPDDVGTWYGGSAVDNQTFFDVEGKALASLNVFSYVKTGATTEVTTTQATTTASQIATESAAMQPITTSKTDSSHSQVPTTTGMNSVVAEGNTDDKINVTSVGTGSSNENETTSIIADTNEEETSEDIDMSDKEDENLEKKTESETMKNDESYVFTVPNEKDADAEEKVNKKDSKGNSVLLIVVVTVLVAATGLGVYVAVKNKKQQAVESEEQEKITDLNEKDDEEE